jgi:DNA-binding MarR family transcriptional regulator
MLENLNEETKKTIGELGRKFSDSTILMHESIAKKAGLTGTDHKYLGLLIKHGVMTAGEFSKLTGLTTGAITGVIDRLEKKRLVKRTFDKADRRKIVLVPDYDKTIKLMGATFTDLQSRIFALVSTFTDNETKIIEKYLLAAIAVMNEFTNELNNNK